MNDFVFSGGHRTEKETSNVTNVTRENLRMISQLPTKVFTDVVMELDLSQSLELIKLLAEQAHLEEDEDGNVDLTTFDTTNVDLDKIDIVRKWINNIHRMNRHMKLHSAAA